MKTLIVDDDDPSSAVLPKGFLSPYGDCDIVDNRKAAIDSFSNAFHGNNPYNLICLDITMPEMDGNMVLS